MSQLATTVCKLEGVKGKLPSQTEVNPRENASAITLRSGKMLEPASFSQNRAQDKTDENETRKEKSANGMKEDNINTPIQKIVIPSPFPDRFARAKKEEAEQEILETFRKVEMNIHLLDAIKQVPRYAKFLKELCTNKRKLSNGEKISVEENASAVIQRKLAQKCKDPGPKLELKRLIKNLKYIYLGEDETLSVIISKELTRVQEEHLIQVLKNNQIAIRWTLADIKGISPSVCMHRILLEKDAQPKQDPQRKLNPTMKEVVMKEILKLLDLGIIYPISTNG
ncbi:hypothetical protein CRG98_013334 [Punica granatum]|uniref:Reverse transcriptase domain-containing protein n=1 Tax=Punica granatum TaxID=22663 RepID=A0A2I0KDK6_PUNGR|nr:hypothetical protein CRG98_013334 [Punica granatum]